MWVHATFLFMNKFDILDIRIFQKSFFLWNFVISPRTCLIKNYSHMFQSSTLITIFLQTYKQIFVLQSPTNNCRRMFMIRSLSIFKTKSLHLIYIYRKCLTYIIPILRFTINTKLHFYFISWYFKCSTNFILHWYLQTNTHKGYH